jgi:hypothetical protein
MSKDSVRAALERVLRNRSSYVSERDDDELSVLRSIFDVVRNDRDVPEIKRGIDLVHEVERRRLHAHTRVNYTGRRTRERVMKTYLVNVESENESE